MKYKTEEERIAAKRESCRRYYHRNKEKIAEYRKNNKEKIAKRKAEYYQNNKEKFAEQNAEYRQKNKEKLAEYRTEYYQKNREKIAKYKAEYRKNNKEKIAEYRSTKYGRAKYLLTSYRRSDRKNNVIKALNRGECTLTVDWIADNIFSGQSCVYCGESDWTKLGCDRKDSYFPHTPENCVPCCYDCNTKKGTTPYDIYMKLIGKIA